MSEIKNAIIKSARINDADRGFLTAWLDLDYGGSGQGFGGHTLYLPKSFTHHGGPNYAGHFIFRCMEIAGVSDWDKIPGKSCRVCIVDGLVSGIGHIVKDDWFHPAREFAGLNLAYKPEAA